MCHQHRFLCFGPMVLCVTVLFFGLAPQAWATDLIANWKFNEPAGSTSFTDSVGGHNASLVGTDTLGTIPGPFGGANAPTGLYFNGLSGTGNYVNVPYSSAFGGMSYLTLSAWVYLPSNYGTSSADWEIFTLCGGRGDTNCTNVFQFGTGVSPIKARPAFYANDGTSSPPTAMDTSFVGGNQDTPGQWQLWTAVYNGGGTNPVTGEDFAFLYINGVVRAWGVCGVPMGNQSLSVEPGAHGRDAEARRRGRGKPVPRQRVPRRAERPRHLDHRADGAVRHPGQ